MVAAHNDTKNADQALLVTERMRLRRFARSDADNLVALDNDPAVMRWLTGGAPTPRDLIEREILPRFCREAADDPPFGFLAAESAASGEFVGWFCLRRAPADPVCVVLGYRLRRECWGRGLATEGCRALMDAGFAAGIERVVATTYEKNVASIRVMERLGMRLVRRFRPSAEELAAGDTTEHSADAEVWDGNDVEYEMSRQVWLASASGKRKAKTS